VLISLLKAVNLEIPLLSVTRGRCDHMRRHGFQVGGTNSGVKRRNFFSVPPNLRCAPNSGGTVGAYHSGKTDIVKITRVKKNKALLTW